MKFIFNKDIRDNRPFAFLLQMYLFLSLLFYIFLFYLEDKNIGLLPAKIKNKILGNNELFVPAMSFQEIILNSHIKLFLYLFSSLVLLVVLVRTEINEKAKIDLSVALFLLIFLDSISTMAVMWWSWFVYVKAISFFTLQILALSIVLYNIWFLSKKPKSSRTSSRAS